MKSLLIGIPITLLLLLCFYLVKVNNLIAWLIVVFLFLFVSWAFGTLWSILFDK